MEKIFTGKNIFDGFYFKTTTVLFVAVLIVGGGVWAAEQNASEGAEIEITKGAKNKVYTSDEDIILSGTAVQSKEIVVFFGDKVGLTESDKNGKWKINFGDMPEGRYSLQLIIDNGSTSRSTATAHIIVDNSKKSLFGYLLSSLSKAIRFDTPEPIKLYPK